MCPDMIDPITARNRLLPTLFRKSISAPEVRFEARYQEYNVNAELRGQSSIIDGSLTVAWNR